MYVAPGGDEEGPRVFEHPGLRVTGCMGEHLLAMKVLAGRRRDEGDITVLVTRLGLTTGAVVEDILASIGDGETLLATPESVAESPHEVRLPQSFVRGDPGVVGLTTDAVKMLGGAGDIQDFPVERMMLDRL